MFAPRENKAFTSSASRPVCSPIKSLRMSVKHWRSLAERASISQFAAKNWGTPALSVLDQADVTQVQAALQGPQGGSVLTTMARRT